MGMGKDVEFEKVSQTAVQQWRLRLFLARHNPWWASYLLREGRAQLQRFCRALKMLWRQKRTAAAAAASGVILLAGSLATEPPTAHAATITVGGSCTLTEAIQNANDTKSGQPNTECAAGDPTGADTIVLAGKSYSYNTAYAAQNALPPITSEITIEGNGAIIQRNVKSAESFRILEVTQSGNLTLNNVTITGGSTSIGGGIYNAGTLTINNSVVSGNDALHGGGIYHYGNYGGPLTISNSEISGNTAAEYGGGIKNYNGALTINNSVISGNDGGTYGGGGIFSYAGSYEAATTILNNSTIRGNNGYYGGGIYNQAVPDGTAMMTLNNSTISGNNAYDGGGIYNSVLPYGTAVTTLNNSTVSGNYAVYYGGGILNRAGLNGATTDINRSLVTGNTAGYYGSEIYNESGTVNANNHNLLGDNGNDNAVAFQGFTPCSGGGCTDITATSDGTDATALANILNPTLGNHGGGTEIHHLVVGSPALDAAPSADCVAAPINGVDQRGQPRNIDGVGDGDAGPGTECDIGAHELQSPTAVTLSQLTVHGEGRASPTAVGAAGVLALFTGWLARVRRRKT
ncbi:MAG: hypothetical protein GY803_07065 [Chloroflexi bacterium]|nr:hypothetical protein [Chloroflexota bacterium]